MLYHIIFKRDQADINLRSDLEARSLAINSKADRVVTDNGRVVYRHVPIHRRGLHTAKKPLPMDQD